jgi:hypothetical protein
MLDLPAKQAAPPWYWRQAPLPDAPLYLTKQDGLQRLGGHQPPAAVSPALLAALGDAGAGGDLLVAEDSSGSAWRLRRAGCAGASQCWQLQELRDSRSRLLAGLRALLAPQLSGSVLHELRNPLNALSLHADLITRLLPAEGRALQAERLTASVDVIKQRLRELSARQDAAVALWFEQPAKTSPPVDLGRLVEASLRLIRGYMSLQELRLRGEALQLLGGVLIDGQHAATLQLVLLAALLMACAGAKRTPAASGGGDVMLLASAADGGLSLELQSALDGETLARELADTDGDGLLATFALLLQPAGIAVDAPAQQGLLRLTFAAR